MARGDSYQLQGQQGGVYLSGTDSSLAKFRVIHALTATVINGITSTNIVDINGDPITSLTLAANTVVGGQFHEISLASGTCICYYA
jgi:hypothetical protein